MIFINIKFIIKNTLYYIILNIYLIQLINIYAIPYGAISVVGCSFWLSKGNFLCLSASVSKDRHWRRNIKVWLCGVRCCNIGEGTLKFGFVVSGVVTLKEEH